MLWLHFSYAISGTIIIICYLPQIHAVMKSKSKLKEISLWAWGLWSACNLISLMYGVKILHDFKFSLFAFLNFIACFIVFAIAGIKRIKN